ncbi:MAG: rhomboid family intramembrane serine protease [Flavobacteriaceae bacterium]|nr:rhomboid family intramembrane serine protease [Flavobacteriaceae bacterium]
MTNNDELKYHPNVFLIPTILVMLIWFVYWIEIKFGLNFNKFGVYPRNLIGFRGVFLTHFIHSNVNHLFNNSIPLFVLISSLLYFYKDVAFKTLLLGSFFTGLLTWLIARDSYHIGASGVVYMLFSFIFFSGIIKRHYRLVALSLIVIFLYGGMIWYILPIKKGMSWEGHLSGFLIGLIFAFLYRRKGIVTKQHQFSKTDFDTFFDENGNLIQEQENDTEKVKEY